MGVTAASEIDARCLGSNVRFGKFARPIGDRKSIIHVFFKKLYGQFPPHRRFLNWLAHAETDYSRILVGHVGGPLDQWVRCRDTRH